MIDLNEFKIHLTQGDIDQLKFCLKHHSEFNGTHYTCKLLVEKRKKYLYEKLFKDTGLSYSFIRDYVVDTEYNVWWKNEFNIN